MRRLVRSAPSLRPHTLCQVSTEEQLLQVANELIRRDVLHDINDECGFDAASLSVSAPRRFRLIDDETPSYLKRRATLASFTSPRHAAALFVPGFRVVTDHNAKCTCPTIPAACLLRLRSYFTGSIRSWRPCCALLTVLGALPAHDEPVGQIHFASVVLFESEFCPPCVNMTVAGAQDKVLKVVSLRGGSPVLAFQSFHGTTGAMTEAEIFLELSSEASRNEWLLMLCSIGIVPELESPSHDSGFAFRQEISSGSAQLLRCAIAPPPP
jgi:hypothetical protein